MFNKKEKKNKDPKNKNILKISKNSYIEVVRHDKDYISVYKVTKIENLFSEGFKEERIKLLPEKEIDTAKLNEQIVKNLERLTDKVEGLTLAYDSNASIVRALNIEQVNNTIQNFETLVEEEIIKREKKNSYKQLIKSEYFENAKKMEIFKGKSDLELAEILIELSKSYSKATGDILEKIRTKEALENV